VDDTKTPNPWLQPLCHLWHWVS